jgi:hypothetical protein
MTHTHTVLAWRDTTGFKYAVPTGCNGEESARGMLAHVLRADSEYDHGALYEYQHGRDVLMEIGHRVGTVAAGVMASAGTINTAMIPVVDQCYRNMMAANAANVPAEYNRCEEMLKATLVLLTNGDMPYAHALRWAFTDSGESTGYYLSEFTRNDLCLEAGEMSQEEYETTLRFAVHCKEGGSEWVDAFATREAAESHAEMLKADTTIEDRHADNARPREYPYVNHDGETVWACCESTIGPACGHRVS